MDWTLILTVTLVGIFIVFASLILLAVCVAYYPKLLRLLKTNKGSVFPKNADAEIITSNDQSLVATQSEDEDFDEIIAVITAAIAAEHVSSGISYIPRIIVKNIRRQATTLPVWNTTGRLESLN